MYIIYLHLVTQPSSETQYAQVHEIWVQDLAKLQCTLCIRRHEGKGEIS